MTKPKLFNVIVLILISFIVSNCSKKVVIGQLDEKIIRIDKNSDYREAYITILSGLVDKTTVLNIEKYAYLQHEEEVKLKKDLLFKEKVLGQQRSYQKDYEFIVNYKADIQHIYVLNEETVQKIMADPKIVDESTFSEYAKQYSIETGTRNKGGILRDVAIGDKITETLAFQLFKDRHSPGDVLVLKDFHGFHIIRILSFNERTLNADSPLNNSVRYGQYLYVDKRMKDLDVKIYFEAMATVWEHDKEYVIFEIDGNKVTSGYIKKYANENLSPVAVAQLKVQLNAPLIKELIGNYIVNKDISTITLDEYEKEQCWLNVRKQYVFDWIQEAKKKIELGKTQKEIIQKEFNSGTFMKPRSMSVVFIRFSNYDAAKQASDVIKTQEDFQKYVKLRKPEYSTTPLLIEGQPSAYDAFYPYFNYKEGTILPLVEHNGNYLLGMVGEKNESKLMTYEEYEKIRKPLFIEANFQSNLIHYFEEEPRFTFDKGFLEKWEKDLEKIQTGKNGSFLRQNEK